MTYDIYSEFYRGWDPELEAIDRERMLEASATSDYPWHREWDSELRDAIYSIANNPPAYIKEPYTWSNYNYLQNASNGCTAINFIRGCACLDEMQIRRGKKIKPKRYFEGWIYAVYHARIAKDYSYKGCSLTGMATAVNTYGVLPYDKFSSSTISDSQMVKLGWNKRQKFEEIYEKYGDEAEKYQVVTTFPKTFEDFIAILDAGYPIAIGTDLAMRIDKKTGYYKAGGRTAHCMVALPPDEKDYRWGNSYGDNIANVTKDTLSKQWSRFKRFESSVALLDIER